MEKRGRRCFKDILEGGFFPNCLMRYSKLSWPAKACWVRLYQYSNKDACCWPSQETLGEELGLSPSRIRQLITELEDAGFIEVEQPTGKDRLMHKTVRYYTLDHEIFDNVPVRKSVMDEEKRQQLQKRAEQKVQREPKKIFAEDSVEMALAEALHELVGDVRKINLQAWAKIMEELIKEGRSSEEIEKVIEFSQKDEFWKKVITDAKGLLRNYPKLLKATQEKPTENSRFNKAGGIMPTDYDTKLNAELAARDRAYTEALLNDDPNADNLRRGRK